MDFSLGFGDGVKIGELGIQGGAASSFSDKISALSPWLWYKTNETSGTEIVDYGSEGNNGTLTPGAGSLNQAGPAIGMVSILFDGTATRINTGAITVSDAQGREGTMLWWVKHDASVWTDTINRQARLFSDTNNRINVGKISNDHLSTQYRANAVNVFNDIAAPNATADWYLTACVWSLSNTYVKLFQIAKGGTTLSSDSDTIAQSFNGSASGTVDVGFAGSVLTGYISNFVILPAPQTEATLQDLANV